MKNLLAIFLMALLFASCEGPMGPPGKDGDDGSKTYWIFDKDIYKNNNSDVVSVLGDDEKVLYNHWLNNGIAEGRTASYVFDAKYYLDNNSDVKAIFGDDYKAAYNHYISGGCNEIRVASAEFNPNIYKANYSDLANLTGEQLVEHYVKNGRAEGRNATTLIKSDQYHNSVD